MYIRTRRGHDFVTPHFSTYVQFLWYISSNSGFTSIKPSQFAIRKHPKTKNQNNLQFLYPFVDGKFLYIFIVKNGPTKEGVSKTVKKRYKARFARYLSAKSYVHKKSARKFQIEHAQCTYVRKARFARYLLAKSYVH